VDPTAYRVSGWLPGYKPAAEFFNYITNQYYLWLDYFREIVDARGYIDDQGVFLADQIASLYNLNTIDFTGTDTYCANYTGEFWLVGGDDTAGTPEIWVIDGGRATYACSGVTAGSLDTVTVVSSNSGTTIAGGIVSSAVTDKLLRSEGGLAFTAVDVSVSDSKSVRAIGKIGSTWWALLDTGAGGLAAEYSTDDGLTWSAGTLSGGGYIRNQHHGSVASDGTTVVAIDRSTPQAFTTSDGQTWTARTLPTPTGAWWSVVYTPSYGWIAFPSDVADTPAASTDGITWATSSTATLPSGWSYGPTATFAYGDLIILMIEGALYYSTDGAVTWTFARYYSSTSSRLCFDIGRLVECNDEIVSIAPRV
jgi:hypothetical protein